MNSHHLSTRNVRGFFAVVAVFCLAAWIATISPAQGQGVSGPIPPPGPVEQAPPAVDVASELPAPPANPQILDGPALPAKAAPTEGVAGITGAPESGSQVRKTPAAFLSDSFTFVKAMDPFVPFISLDPTLQVRVTEEGEEAPPEMERPLTPLQKMTIAEIERGLKAISWGALGRRAVIEDATRKGFIVSVGTPAGERNGVVTQILNDRLVIQQEIWDKNLKRRVPQDQTIKLDKKTDERKAKGGNKG